MRHLTLITLAAFSGLSLIAGCGGGNTPNVVPPIGSTRPTVSVPGAVTFDSTGKFAYVVQLGAKLIHGFAVNSDSSVTLLSPATASTTGYPNFLASAHNAGGSFLYVTTANVGGTTVDQFMIGSGGTLTPLNPPTVPTVGAGALAIAVDPTNHFVYTADSGSGIDEFKINPDGTLTSIGLFPIGPMNQLTISRDGKWMFANATNGANHITVLMLNADGTLTPSSYAGPSQYTLLVTNPTKSVLYALDGITSGSTYHLDAFSIAGDGSLAPLGQPVAVPRASNGNPLTIAPNGNAIYLADPQNADVAQVRINSDGSLSAMSPATVGADGPTTAVAITPDGTHVFASAPSVVDTYKVGSNGTLTKL